MATDQSQSNSNDSSKSDSGDLAAEVIRQKISSLYAQQSKEQQEPSARLEEAADPLIEHRSKHQQFMHQLTTSGKSLPEVQTAWHEYYTGLSDAEKHQVWEEFYSERAKAKQAEAEAAAKVNEPVAKEETKSKAKPAGRTTAAVKKQLLGQVKGQRQLKAKHHIQSVIFGLAIGSVAVIILLFGFFNERIIAPFISPSRTVTNTPIIAGGSEVASNTNEIIIPKINVQIPVIYDEKSIAEPAVEAALERGVVHYATTPNPGELGNAVIFGHSSNNILNKGKYKFAFVLLNRLQVGDTFTLTFNGKRYVYRVYDKKIVKPADVSVLGPTDKPATATLITCDPPGTSTNRLIVVGEQISPSPSGNTPSTAIKTDQTVSTIPSQAPSLWQHILGWFKN